MAIAIGVIQPESRSNIVMIGSADDVVAEAAYTMPQMTM